MKAEKTILKFFCNQFQNPDLLRYFQPYGIIIDLFEPRPNLGENACRVLAKLAQARMLAVQCRRWRLVSSKIPRAFRSACQAGHSGSMLFLGAKNRSNGAQSQETFLISIK